MFNLDVIDRVKMASQATAGNTVPHNVGKGATQKAVNTRVKYYKNIHFVYGEFVHTDGRNVEFEDPNYM